MLGFRSSADADSRGQQGASVCGWCGVVSHPVVRVIFGFVLGGLVQRSLSVLILGGPQRTVTSLPQVRPFVPKYDTFAGDCNAGEPWRSASPRGPAAAEPPPGALQNHRTENPFIGCIRGVATPDSTGTLRRHEQQSRTEICGTVQWGLPIAVGGRVVHHCPFVQQQLHRRQVIVLDLSHHNESRRLAPARKGRGCGCGSLTAIIKPVCFFMQALRNPGGAHPQPRRSDEMALAAATRCSSTRGARRSKPARATVGGCEAQSGSNRAAMRGPPVAHDVLQRGPHRHVPAMRGQRRKNGDDEQAT